MIAAILAAAIVIGCQIPAARNHDRQQAQQTKATK
jgi:hypothetical protein